MRFVFIAVMILMTGCEYFSVEKKIMSKGQSTPAELAQFFKSRNKNIAPKSLNFIAKAYVTEAYKEGASTLILRSFRCALRLIGFVSVVRFLLNRITFAGWELWTVEQKGRVFLRSVPG